MYTMQAYAWTYTCTYGMERAKRPVTPSDTIIVRTPPAEEEEAFVPSPGPGVVLQYLRVRSACTSTYHTHAYHAHTNPRTAYIHTQHTYIHAYVHT